MEKSRQVTPKETFAAGFSQAKSGIAGLVVPALSDLASRAVHGPEVQKLNALQRMADRHSGANVGPAEIFTPMMQTTAKVLQRRGHKHEVKLSKTESRYAMKFGALSRLGQTDEEIAERTKKQKTVQDAIKVREIMRDLEGRVPDGLAQLEADIHAQCEMSSAERPNTRHLSRALSVREKQCGLGVSQAIYTGLLSAAEFEAEAVTGALANDFGAVTTAMGHGEFTHRIQWYVLMHAMSDGFTVNVANEPPEGFNFPPKELLINILTGGVEFEPSEMGPAGMSPGRNNLWDVLFDRASGEAGHDPENEEVGITDPERMMSMLGDEQIGKPMVGAERIFGKLAGAAPELSRIVTKRTELRKRQAALHAGGYLDREAYEGRKLDEVDPKTHENRYKRTGRRVLVRNRPQALVGNKAAGETHVSYAPDVEV